MSNIHSGGALQVSISFLNELCINDPKDDVDLYISSEIADQIDLVHFIERGWNIKVYDVYGYKALFSLFNLIQLRYRVVFTLFGPKYTLLKARKDVVGFAQFWILALDNPLMKQFAFFDQLMLKVKFGLQKFFFRRADHLVVELEHVKCALSSQRVFPKEKISVVYNALSDLYYKPACWQSINIESKEYEIAIGFITRDYPHKNIAVLPKVAEILHKSYHLPVRFYFSLNQNEWSNYKDKFGDYGCTVGSLNVSQCPSFYERMDAVIFPSLLECFSVTPLEALAMRKPLFASDRGFVRDVCKEHAIYFDPLNPESIAKVIADYFRSPLKSQHHLEEGSKHAFQFSTAEQRAQDYLKIIQNHLEN